MPTWTAAARQGGVRSLPSTISLTHRSSLIFQRLASYLSTQVDPDCTIPEGHTASPRDVRTRDDPIAAARIKPDRFIFHSFRKTCARERKTANVWTMAGPRCKVGIEAG